MICFSNPENPLVPKSFFSDVLTSSNDGVAVVDKRGAIKFISPGMKNLFGYDLKEIPDIFKWSELVIPDPNMRQRVIGSWSRDVLKQEQPERIFEFINKYGETRWCRIQFSAMDDKSFVVNGYDITEHKRIEAELEDSRAKYKQLYTHAPVGIYEIDFKTGKFVNVNDVICEYLGCSKEELLTKSPFDFLARECREKFIDRFKKVLSGTKVSDAIELEIIRKDGKRLSVVLHNNFIFENDKVTGSHVVVHNITTLKNVERQLRKSRERFKTLVETTSDWIWEFDRQGLYTYCSPNVVGVIGYTHEELIGRPFYTFIVEREQKNMLDMLDNEESCSRPFVNLENRLINKNGNEVIIETSGVPFFDDYGNLAGFRGINRDVTEKKKQENERNTLQKKLARSRKMEALGLLAGGVAHDLNNILSGIISYPDLLLMDLPKDSKLRKPIRTIKNSGMRAAAVVSDLLTIARGVTSIKEILSLNDLIAEYLESPEFIKIKDIYPEIKVETVFEKDLMNIRGSKVHIKKTVMNLVANAMEAIEVKGTIRITTANKYVDSCLKGYDDVKIGEYVVLSIYDDGPGISDENLDRIFEPFYTRKVMGRSGTGLGLAVVWNTMQDHDGYIDVQSGNNGSVFNLYLPITRESVEKISEIIPMDDYLGHGERILVIDDEPIQREIASAMLEKLRYVAENVSSGEAAVDYLKENDAECIILDMIMQGMSGRQTYEEIIKIKPGQKAVIASGYSKTDDAVKIQMLGAGTYVKKPYTMEKIGLALKEVLGRGQTTHSPPVSL